MRHEKDELRRDMHASAKGPLRLFATARTATGGREIIMSRRVRPRFHTAIGRPPATAMRSGHGDAATASQQQAQPAGE